jgi:hypothetical protein
MTTDDRDRMAAAIGCPKKGFDYPIESLGNPWVDVWHPDESDDDFRPVLEWMDRPENFKTRIRFLNNLVIPRLGKENYNMTWTLLMLTPAEKCAAFLEAIKREET